MMSMPDRHIFPRNLARKQRGCIITPEAVFFPVLQYKFVMLQGQFAELSPQVRIYNRNFYIRRSEHQKLLQERQRQIEELASKPKVNLQSYNILVQRLEKQLGTLLAPYGEEIDFAAFQEVAVNVGGLGKEGQGQQGRRVEEVLTQFWLVLVEYDIERRTLPPQEVQSLLTLLFCPHPLRQSEIIELLAYKYPSLEHQRTNYIAEYPEAEGECLCLPELVEGWLKVRQKYCASFAAPKKLPRQDPTSAFPFRPSINQRSKEMAGRSLQKYLSSNRLQSLPQSNVNELSGYISAGPSLSYHEILYRRGLEKEQILKTAREPAGTTSEEQRRLSAQEERRLVENLYFRRERREDVDHEKLKEEAELKLCTFKPELVANYRPSASPIPIRNYDKEVGRLQKGRRDKQKKREAMDNLGRVKNKSPAPPSFIEREKPRLILQIKVGERVEEVRLKGDQEPRLVAKKFVRMHGLAADMQEVLQAIIQEQLAAL